MRVLLAVCLTACLVALLAPAQADLVCGTKYCQEHPCTAPVTAASCGTSATYRPHHAGKCACCPACVTLLSKGEPCKTYSSELGETPAAVCREPLRCVSGKCEAILRN